MEQQVKERREARRQAALKRKKEHRRRLLLVFGSLTLVLVLLLIPILNSCGGEGETEPPVETTPQESDYVTPTEPEVTYSANILAVGDNLMHQQIVISSQNPDGSYDFSGLYERLASEFQSADLSILCQETILVEDEGDTNNSLPYYGTTSQLAPAVASAGFDLVAQATEHTYDKTMDDIIFTKQLWDSYGVSALGIHDSQVNADAVVVREVNNIRVAFLNYTYADSETDRPDETYAVDYLENADAIAQKISFARSQADAVIVVAHWGEMTTYEANDFQKTWAQFFADNGVSAVIGSHTHTLQPVELRVGQNGNYMPVFYSLGNYMTDMGRYYNMLGGMAQLTLTKDSNGTYVSAYSLTPLMQMVDVSDGSYRYYTIKLSDYTEELAAAHNLDHVSPTQMQELYRSIILTDVNVCLDPPAASSYLQPDLSSGISQSDTDPYTGTEGMFTSEPATDSSTDPLDTTGPDIQTTGEDQSITEPQQP